MDIITSIVRTVTPFVVGALVAWFARHNITFDSDFLANLAKVLDLIIGSLIYVVARFLETKVSPKFGWLLLWPKQPTYVPQVVNPTEGLLQAPEEEQPQNIPPADQNTDADAGTSPADPVE